MTDEDKGNAEIPEGLGPDEPPEEGDEPELEITPARCPLCESLAVLPKDENTVACIICEKEWDSPEAFREELEASRRFSIDMKHAGLYLMKNGLRLVANATELLATEPAKELAEIVRGLFKK